MKYLYIRLNKKEIITFKRVTVNRTEEGIYQVIFNGTLGLFLECYSEKEAFDVIDKIQEYLVSDEPSKRILDLS